MVQEIRKRRNDTPSSPKNQKTPEPEKKVTAKDDKVTGDEVIKPKYGPHVTFPYQRVWSRSILIVGVIIVVWYNSTNGKEVALARQKDILVHRGQNVDCAPDYKAEIAKFSGCMPEKCGRIVTDKLVSATETDTLLKIAQSGFNLGGSSGGASILDLQTGALSKGKVFINIYSLEAAKKIFNNADFAIYRVVKTKIQSAIAHHFGVDASSIYLTNPTFFSRITSAPAKTPHDEYWHPHVDKETYEAFHYTSLLYLSDYNRDFEGGRFLFIDPNSVNTTVEPRKGRVSIFTSGSENLHAVEKVTSGTRYALTVSFTCDKQFAIDVPTLEKGLKSVKKTKQ